jgi:hypothetical protein
MVHLLNKWIRAKHGPSLLQLSFPPLLSPTQNWWVY